MTDRSGAYLFRPNSAAQELSGGTRSLIRSCSGPILNTLHVYPPPPFESYIHTLLLTDNDSRHWFHVIDTYK
jgi:hypothetical protein